MDTNGKADSPIVYPRLEIPGKGTFEVRFSWGAICYLEDQLGMDLEAFGVEIQKWFPRPDPSNEGEQIPGRVSSTLLAKVLAACIGDQIKIEWMDLAYCFSTLDDIKRASAAVGEAFSKASWSIPKPTPEPATIDLRETAPIN